MQKFRALGAPPPDSPNSPPLRISGYAPAKNGEIDKFKTILLKNKEITFWPQEEVLQIISPKWP